MSKKIEQSYYAVWKGFTVGVFNTWNEAQKSTDGYSGSAHHKFNDYGDAVRKVKEELTKQGYMPPFAYHDCNNGEELW